MLTTFQKSQQLLAEHTEKLAQATERNWYLEDQFRIALQKQFGKSTEDFDAQGQLFNEAEDIIEQSGKLATQDISYTRKTPDQKHEIEQAKPMTDKLYKWLAQNQPRLVGKTKLAETATYLANQWHKLVVYLEDGKLNFDNNRAKRVGSKK